MQWLSTPPTVGDTVEISRDGAKWFEFECCRAEDGHLYLQAASPSTVRAVSGHGGRVIAYTSPGLQGRIKRPAERIPSGQMSLWELEGS